MPTASPQHPLIQLFHFLTAFAASHQPLPRQLNQQPLADSARFWDELPQSNDYVHVTNHPEDEREWLLQVSLPPQHPCPQPPSVIEDWLANAWQDWRTVEVNHHSQKTHKPFLAKTEIEQFSDNEQRVTAWQTWLSAREQWREVQQRYQTIRDLFAKLQMIYTELQKQSGDLELVLGCAMLQKEPTYQHPLLIKPVQLHFDGLKNRFTLEDSERNTELYLPLLTEITENANLISQTWQTQIESLHPLDEAARVHTQAMQDWLSNQPDCAEVKIDYRPVLFIRSRGGWTAQVATDIVKQLENRHLGDIPLYLRRLAGISAEQTAQNQTTAHTSPENILFALPANPEQYQLAQQLETHDIVLVQGPPGTGKTHTIANLIGHLLAQKKRILITSHSSKALRVLREKVPENIRSLCVSVLDDDKKSKLELGEAVAALSQKMAQGGQLQIAANQLQQQRTQLLSAQKQQLHGQQLCLRCEYEPIIIGGAETPPSEAARIVSDGVGKHDWLPPLLEQERGKLCPLSPTELQWLYASQALIPFAAEQELAAGLPALNDLPSPDDWQQTITTLQQHQQAANSRQHWLWPRLETVHISRLSDSLTTLESLSLELKNLRQQGLWLDHLVEAGLDSPLSHDAWLDFFKLIEHSHQQTQQAQSLLLEYAPSLSPELCADAETLTTLNEIHAYLSAGGSFSWWKMLVNPAWKTILQAARCNDANVSQQVHIEALIAYVSHQQSQQRLIRRWQRQILVINGAELNPQQPSKSAIDWLPHLQQAFLWGQQRWQLFVSQHIQPLGLTLTQLELHITPDLHAQTPRLTRTQQLIQQELIPEWQAHLARHSAEQVATTIHHSQQKLQPFLAHRPSTSVIHALLQALQQQNITAYRDAYQQLQSLLSLSADYQQRLNLLNKLEQGAQQWAQALRLRQPPHHAPLATDKDILHAWRWRQLHDELQYRQQLDLDSISRQLQQTTDDLQRVTAELISQKTWAHQVVAAEPYRQHLIGWQQTQTKIGKGTGKQAQRFRQLAQQQLKQAQYAVPVWIMPLAEVFRSFQVDSQFDVVIVDEACQVDISGLLATYLGKKVVIVGDDEQVSPDAVGTDSGIAQRLQQQYLQDIPNAHLYDGQTSLYDLSKQVAKGQLCLLEHFRCVPAIIGFSNQLSYQGRIKALREPASSQLQAHVVPYRVQGERIGKAKINHGEASAIVKLIQAMCNHPAYTEKTFGVISLLGNEQATLIELQLRAVLPMSVIEERRLLCGNSAQFQGDERDVILLSMVDSNEGDVVSVMRLQGDGARDMYKKRYNVAVSRARDQLWIVHSVNYQTDLKPTDLRRQLLEYAHEQATAHINTETQQTESVFEELVLKQLLARGYQVQTQYPVGYYRIDLVVMGENSRLAVECDGDKYHSGSEKIAEDLARQAILERLGWQFYRIRGSVFFREPEQALAGLWQRLADLGIQPILAEHAVNSSDELLHHEIIRLAEQMDANIEPETVIEEIASTPAVEELPNHQSINELFRQRSEARRKGLI